MTTAQQIYRQLRRCDVPPDEAREKTHHILEYTEFDDLIRMETDCMELNFESADGR